MAKVMVAIEVDETYTNLAKALLNNKSIGNIKFSHDGVLIPRRYVDGCFSEASLKYKFQCIGVRP
ncbi:MAG: hypothetical protein KJ556_20025 [Gammaproteobacteria bacterium]|nr:hypothetical protein [Gammaproteobacteria bacterium]